jgi:hypothetical protein
VFFLTSCSANAYQDNPVGYNFLFKLDSSSFTKTITPPADTTKAKVYAHVKDLGIGSTLAGFITKYGAPLKASQPPTMYVFRASTLDVFPKGSTIIVSLENGNQDMVPRVVQISYVAGDNHPTTYAQAQTIAESFLPDDIVGPSTINKFNGNTAVCLSKSYSSAALSTVFPAQDFTAADGSVAKAGTVVASFFPHFSHQDQYNNQQQEHTGSGYDPDTSDTISSVLITPGTKPYC